MSEEKPESFKDVFNTLNKKDKREVLKTVVNWYVKIPPKFLKAKGKVALTNIKKWNKAFIKKLKNLGTTMEKKLKEAKISDYFKRDDKKENGK